jgi:hypothetical protein
MPEKDPERAQRLNEVYKHLFAFYDVTSKTGLAKILGIQRTGLAAAFGGNKANLTDSLFKNICKTFPGVFNLDYLLTGNGSLLSDKEKIKTETHEAQASVAESQKAFDDLLVMYSRLVRENDDLRVMLKQELEEVRAVKESMQKAREEMRDTAYLINRMLTAINNLPTLHVDMAAEEATTTTTQTTPVSPYEK